MEGGVGIRPDLNSLRIQIGKADGFRLFCKISKVYFIVKTHQYPVPRCTQYDIIKNTLTIQPSKSSIGFFLIQIMFKYHIIWLNFLNWYLYIISFLISLFWKCILKSYSKGFWANIGKRLGRLVFVTLWSHFTSGFASK